MANLNDIHVVLTTDPAARHPIEVVLCYPGPHAVWLHHLAHAAWSQEHYILGRLLPYFSRFLTGIEVYPGASIGRRLFIDHGASVVIDETADIGDDVVCTTVLPWVVHSNEKTPSNN